MTAGPPIPRPRRADVAPPPVPDDDAEVGDPRVLAGRLRELQGQRRALEREAEQLPQILRGIAVTRRDRDAGVSKALRSHRAQLERICVSAEELITAATRVAVRLQLHDGGDRDPVTYRARRALRQSQDALAALSHGSQEVR